MFTALLKSPAAKWFLVPAVAGAAWYGNQWASTQSHAQAPWVQPALFTGSPPSFGGGSFGQPVEKEITVLSGYTTQTGLMLLNDKDNYRDPTSLTIVVDVKRIQAAGTDGRALVGRTVKVKGRTQVYKGKQEIMADTIEVK